MKKYFSIIFVMLLLNVSALAQPMWTQDGTNYHFGWSNTTQKTTTIINGESATFNTGVFGTLKNSDIQLKIDLEKKGTGIIVANLYTGTFSGDKTHQLDITLDQKDYKKDGEYRVLVYLEDNDAAYNEPNNFLNLVVKKKPLPFIFIPNFPFINIPIVNLIPTLESVDNAMEVSENDQLSFSLKGSDPEGKTVNYKATGVCPRVIGCLFSDYLPQGAQFNKETGTFTFNPNYEFVDHKGALTKDVTIYLSSYDGSVYSKEQKVTITVKDVNRDPKITSTPVIVAKVGVEYTYKLTAQDQDNDKLHFTLANTRSPRGMKLVDNTLVWTPERTQTDDTYTVFSHVEDQFGGKDIQRFIIKLDPADTIPPIPAKAACDDGVDNDGDTRIDMADPGCTSKDDNDETDSVTSPPPTPKAQCADGIDNDGDGKVDFGADPGCESKDDNDETDSVTSPPPTPKSQCHDGLDNDGDGKVDFGADPGCESDQDNDETDPVTHPIPPTPTPKAQCEDGLDNDGDGKVDFGADPGCESEQDNDETDPVTPPIPPIVEPKPVPQPSKNADLHITMAHMVPEVVNIGEKFVLSVRAQNKGLKDADNTKISVFIYGANIYQSTGNFDLDSGDSKTTNMLVNVPSYIRPGTYTVVVRASNGNERAVAYRLATFR